MTDNALETAERLIGEENVRKLKWAAITCVWCADEAAREQDLETAWNWSERAVLGRNKFRQWARAWKRAAKKWFDLAQIGGEYAAENSQIADEFLAQRNEARDWAIRMKYERDLLQTQNDELRDDLADALTELDGYAAVCWGHHRRSSHWESGDDPSES